MNKYQEYIVKGEKVFVGLEDSKRSWKICARSNGNIISETSMPAEYVILHSFFQNKFPECQIKVIYEAGFSGFWLHDRLVKDGIECVVTPPNKVTEQKANKVKTDKVDARRLALVLENNDYSACNIPDQERREDRQISRTLNQIQRNIIETKNHIRRMFDFHGIESGRNERFWTDEKYLALKTLEMSKTLKGCLNIYLDLLKRLLAYRDLLEKRLTALTEKPSYQKACACLKSAPGIGPLTAIRLTLEWGTNLNRFSSSKEFASFTGLTCSEYSTGEKVRKGHITAQSNPYVRSWLIQCAWRAYTKDPVLYKKFRAVQTNSGSKKKAIVAVARKIAVRLRRLVISEHPYQLGLLS